MNDNDDALVEKQQELMGTKISDEELERVGNLINELGLARTALILSKIVDVVADSLALDMKAKEFAVTAGTASALRGISMSMSPYNFVVGLRGKE